jgi:hypothetical protein
MHEVLILNPVDTIPQLLTKFLKSLHASCREISQIYTWNALYILERKIVLKPKPEYIP